MRGRWTSACRRFRARAASGFVHRSQPAANRRAREIEAEHIKLLYTQLPPAVFATLVVGFLVAYVLWKQVPRPLLVGWLAVLILLSVARLWLMRSFFSSRPSAAEAARWGQRFVVGVGLSGLLWGVAGIFPFQQPKLVHEVFLAFVLAGLSAGAMTTLSAFRGAFAVFLVPAVLPFAARLTLQGGDVLFAMGAMLLLFVTMMTIISQRLYRSISESLRLRFDNLDLLDDLAAARDRQQAVNQELEVEMQERRRMQAELQARNEIYRTLVDTTGTGYHILDAEGRVLDANSVYVQLTGHRTLAEIIGRRVTEWTAAHDLQRNAEEIAKCIASGYVRSLEIDYVDAAGSVTPIEINATVVTTDGVPRILGFSRAISERKSAERALRQAHDQLGKMVDERTAQLAQANEVLRAEKELFRVTLASIGDAVITTDAADSVTYLNAVAEHLTGWSNAEACGQPMTRVFRVVDETTREPVRNPVEAWLRNDDIGAQNHGLLLSRDEREIHIDTSVAPIRDARNAAIGAVLIFRDVTAQRKLAQQLSHQATHDALTDLVNRYEFERRLSQLLASANEHVQHALLYLDLDQFKVVNDTCGHVAGDELLRQIAALLRTKLRSRDTLARLGGDEFGVLLEHCSVREAKRIAETLRELLQEFRFGWQDKSFTIGVSIGLVPLARTGETVSLVLSAADSSCYAAKEKGRNRVHVYQADDSTLAQREGEMRWMPRIQKALEEDRFCLYYQPIVPVRATTAVEKQGEILLRMFDEEGRLVPPGAFLPAAERYGLMPAIDRWVVSKTLESLSAMPDKGEEIIFAINLSAQSLGTADFLEFVTDQLDRKKVSPRKLCFEITESSAVSELTHVLRFMKTLRALGCRFALDDFGTGLSSFSYLKTLPVQYLKIDGAFVKDLATDAIDRAMVEAVHRIGHIMGLQTIAEWVESDAILEKLRGIGVDYCQGYAIGEPRPLQTH